MTMNGPAGQLVGNTEGEEMSFVIAHPDADGNLCIYTYVSEVHLGNAQDAKALLDYVRRQEPEIDWRVYRVTYAEVGIE